MHTMQLNSQYYEQHTSPSDGRKRRPAGPKDRHPEGETAMKTMTVMIEWSAVAIALYATLTLAMPIEALASIV